MFPLGRPTHWKACRLKSFYLNFRSKLFFISVISGPFLSSLFPFLHFTITGSFCWYDCGNGNENEKKNFLPTLFLKGGSAEWKHTYFFNVASLPITTNVMSSNPAHFELCAGYLYHSIAEILLKVELNVIITHNTIFKSQF